MPACLGLETARFIFSSPLGLRTRTRSKLFVIAYRSVVPAVNGSTFLAVSVYCKYRLVSAPKCKTLKCAKLEYEC